MEITVILQDCLICIDMVLNKKKSCTIVLVSIHRKGNNKVLKYKK